MDLKKATLAIVMGISAAYCKAPETSKAVDEVVENAPQVCEDKCAEESVCSIEGDIRGELADDAIDAVEDECLIECAYSIEKGAYVVANTNGSLSGGDYGPGWLSVSKKVSGMTVKKHLECMWDLGFMRCGKDSEPIWDERTCYGYDECLAVLGIDRFATWEDGSCIVEGEENLM